MLDIIKAYAVNNLCYKAAQKMTPKGIVVHSTGANNPYLKRYVDAPSEVGSNRYGNHWNVERPGGQSVCVHAFIGYDKGGIVRVAEILPLTICCWGVGNGSKGSYNYDPAYIQFEICEDDLTDKAYYTKAFSVAAEYCAQLCKEYHISVDNVVGHTEAHKLGYGSNHADPEHWMKKFGHTMADFRKAVSDRLNNTEQPAKKVTASQNIAVASKAIKAGDLVAIAKDAVYYGGANMPGWVKSQHWYVKQSPVGNRVVIDKNERGTQSICSPVHKQYLTVVRAASKTKKTTQQVMTPYRVKVKVDSLIIRKGAGTNTEKLGSITDNGVYTIVEEKTGIGASKWGRLKSGAGWISLDYVKKL